jgi:hypothetical protein
MDLTLVRFGAHHFIATAVSRPGVDWLVGHGFRVGDGDPLVFPVVGLPNVLRAMRRDGLVVDGPVPCTLTRRA